MKEIYLVITIDTEADHAVTWTKSDPLTFNSVTRSIPDMLEATFKRYGAVGTYLLAIEVLEDRRALEVIKSLREPHELGTHLHPDYIEPQRRYSRYEGTYSKDFSNNFAPDIEKEKIGFITKAFTEKVGYEPKVYRGGKFGFGESTAAFLEELGYLVDTSVTPHVSWKNIGGPDFKKSPDQPYFVNTRRGNKKLLEVPVSIAYLNAFQRLFNRPAWLRPSFGKISEIKALVDNFIERYREKNRLVLNMMFHTMEFYPGASPYSRTEEDCQRLLKRLESIIKYCRDIGIKFCKLSEVRNLYNDIL